MNQEPTPDGLAELQRWPTSARLPAPGTMKSIIPQLLVLNVTVLEQVPAADLARRVAADSPARGRAAELVAPVQQSRRAARSLRSRSNCNGALHEALGSPGRGAAKPGRVPSHLPSWPRTPVPLGGGRARWSSTWRRRAAAAARLVPDVMPLVEIPHGNAAAAVHTGGGGG